MRRILIFAMVLALSGPFLGCTNDEGDEDIDVITPEEEEQRDSY